MSARVEVALPKDATGFIRRQCPGCHRIFKTLPNRFDARVLQRRLVSLFPFENADEGYEEVPHWHCLYCGHHAEADEWLAPEHVSYLESLSRAWANHVRYEQLAYVSRTLSYNPRPTFIAVAPEALPEPLPAEPEDLRVIPMVCCGEDVKAEWDWDGPMYCPRCGAHHGGMSGRQQVHLQFIQE
ncbi:hypothetical protein [Hyalangium rubrum]|uniref:Uncharacterized protein n=1 Tax=Hyalangium rubrum TaxID=3103134 RepID=A0ABU5HIH1_9BACT|nr:hypothetical protein [Hyalangium sp. s54d21]MDY7233239.1 hypothetical protein [Hyalangium sp. s54d21]